MRILSKILQPQQLTQEPQPPWWTRLPDPIVILIISIFAIVVGIVFGAAADYFTSDSHEWSEIEQTHSNQQRGKEGSLQRNLRGPIDGEHTFVPEHADLESPHSEQNPLLDLGKMTTYDYTVTSLSQINLKITPQQQQTLRQALGLVERVSEYRSKIHNLHNNGTIRRDQLLREIEKRLTQRTFEKNVTPQFIEKVSQFAELQDEMSLDSIASIGNCPELNAESIIADFISKVNTNRLTRGDLYEFVTMCWQQADLVCHYRTLDCAHSDIVMALPKELNCAHEHLFLFSDATRDADVVQLYRMVESLKAILGNSVSLIYESFVAPTERERFSTLPDAEEFRRRNDATRPALPEIVQSKLQVRSNADALAIEARRVNDPKVRLELNLWKLERELQDALWLPSARPTEVVQSQIDQLKREYAEDYERAPPRPFPNWRDAPVDLNIRR